MQGLRTASRGAQGLRTGASMATPSTWACGDIAGRKYSFREGDLLYPLSKISHPFANDCVCCKMVTSTVERVIDSLHEWTVAQRKKLLYDIRVKLEGWNQRHVTIKVYIVHDIRCQRTKSVIYRDGCSIGARDKGFWALVESFAKNYLNSEGAHIAAMAMQEANEARASVARLEEKVEVLGHRQEQESRKRKQLGCQVEQVQREQASTSQAVTSLSRTFSSLRVLCDEQRNIVDRVAHLALLAPADLQRLVEAWSSNPYTCQLCEQHVGAGQGNLARFCGQFCPSEHSGHWLCKIYATGIFESSQDTFRDGVHARHHNRVPLACPWCRGSNVVAHRRVAFGQLVPADLMVHLDDGRRLRLSAWAGLTVAPQIVRHEMDEQLANRLAMDWEGAAEQEAAAG